jgi:hypothetical protein
VPFQPNGFTTRSASTPSSPDASTSPFGDAQHAEVDALARERASRAPPARTSASRCAGRSRRHLARQRLDDAERDERRRVPLVAAAVRSPSPGGSAVGLGAGAVRAADPVARRAGDGLRAAEAPPCTRRNGPRGADAALPPPSPSAKLYSCSKSSSPRSASWSGQSTPPARRSGSRAGHHLGRKEPGAAASRRAERVPARGEAAAPRAPASRLSGAGRRAARSRRARRAPRVRAPPAARREAQSHERRRQGPGHGTKSFGWRECEARKTRTAARPPSSSVR